MFVVNKITQEYDPFEDRIRLNLEIQNGLCVTLWVTQRLLNSLIQTLTKLIDESLKRELNAKSAAKIDNLQTWKQTLASASLPKAASVEVGDIIDMGLMTSVEISRKKENYIIFLKWQADGKARMTLNDLQLRQLLDVCSRLITKAKWRIDNFPEWLMIKKLESDHT